LPISHTLHFLSFAFWQADSIDSSDYLHLAPLTQLSHLEVRCEVRPGQLLPALVSLGALLLALDLKSVKELSVHLLTQTLQACPLLVRFALREAQMLKAEGLDDSSTAIVQVVEVLSNIYGEGKSLEMLSLAYVTFVQPAGLRANLV
jgi:hypothetical protein